MISHETSFLKKICSFKNLHVKNFYKNHQILYLQSLQSGLDSLTMASLGALSDGPVFALSALQLFDHHLRDTANIIQSLGLWELALQQGGAEENGQIVQDAAVFPSPIDPLIKT